MSDDFFITLLSFRDKQKQMRHTIKTKDNWEPDGKKNADIQRALKQNESKVAAEENEGQQGHSSHHRESTAYLKKMHCNL